MNDELDYVEAKDVVDEETVVPWRPVHQAEGQGQQLEDLLNNLAAGGVNILSKKLIDMEKSL